MIHFENWSVDSKEKKGDKKRGNGTWWLQADTSPFILH